MIEPDKAALAAAQGLTGAVTALSGDVRRLRRYGRHNRWFIAVDVALTVLLAFTGAVSVHAVQTANSASSAQLALCRAGNVSRAQQVGIWEFVLSLSSKKPETAQERQVRVLFENRLHRTFAARNCAALGKGGH